MRSCPTRRLAGVLLAVGLLGPATAARAEGPPDPAALAVRLDALVNQRLREAHVTPAPRADDAAFLRRVYLDLVGRVPLPQEVHAFLADKSPDKRRKVVDRLLKTPGHVNHFTNVWRHLLLPETSANLEIRFLQPGFEFWLQEKLRANTPYDKMVYELLTTPIDTGRGRNTPQPGLPGNGGNPLAFFQAKEGKPENLAAATARVFMGVQIECAQCHNHPFARWTRDQFWGMAAFFGGIERTGPNVFNPVREVIDRRELAIPNSDRVVQASFLDDKEPQWKFKTSARVTLAEWLTAPDNPWFARAAANRMWAHLMGVGIIDPVDDLNDDNKPTHPELLDELAKAFVEAKFDTHYLIRAITATEAYQRTSAMTHPSQADPRLFARMSVKALSGEQLFDSLATATGFRDPNFNRNPFAFNPGSPRALFLDKFAPQGKRTEPQTSVLQALTLMNGRFVADATNVENSAVLGAIATAPLMSTPERIEALYVATLSRKPTPEEMRRLLRHVEAGGPREVRQRLGDVMWVLLNSAEFRVNH